MAKKECLGASGRKQTPKPESRRRKNCSGGVVWRIMASKSIRCATSSGTDEGEDFRRRMFFTSADWAVCRPRHGFKKVDHVPLVSVRRSGEAGFRGLNQI